MTILFGANCLPATELNASPPNLSNRSLVFISLYLVNASMFTYLLLFFISHKKEADCIGLFFVAYITFIVFLALCASAPGDRGARGLRGAR